MKVRIEEYYDGFSITVIGDDGSEKRFSFDQEDNKEELVEVFKLLTGAPVEYEEVY